MKCFKGFPKDIQPATVAKDDGHPLSRRKQDGRGKKFKAHINVEVCATVKAIKFIYNYIYKGSDQTRVRVQNNNDEIRKYLNGSYISPVEAVWRLFSFPLHEESLSATKLATHLPEQQPVYFQPIASIEGPCLTTAIQL
ncbi:hypothetical protein [Parasitella parasitica]|uniref:Uncharacterized protein n=1 Tax=Parasitella parasitica TaxID=35722 RepID=A0A0B7NGR1_9FUNG|nr:hypothetical protein [Parasitella parasitica]